MANTLFQRLRGLVDRQVFFMPFSRKVEIKEKASLRIQALLKDCVSWGLCYRHWPVGPTDLPFARTNQT